MGSYRELPKHIGLCQISFKNPPKVRISQICEGEEENTREEAENVPMSSLSYALSLQMPPLSSGAIVAVVRPISFNM
uniref:Uncharacterized protein n=1 Tax=Cucumis melo TaxID=3656 RepID=A0A9I9DP93_CUCME